LSEEREEPMSSDPGDERPEIDDKTISEVVRKPTRTAGDLSEVAGGPAGITTENVARDLETAASKSRLSTDRDLLKELLDRVRRIERYGDEISELTERVRKIERRIASSPVSRSVDRPGAVEPVNPVSSERPKPLGTVRGPVPLAKPPSSEGEA
jgi:hypothetical protein